MKALPLVFIVLIAFQVPLMGCTTVVGTQKEKGARIGSSPVGTPTVTSRTLEVSGSTLRSIEFTLHNNTVQRHEREFRELERTTYQNWRPDFFGLLLMGIGIFGVGAGVYGIRETYTGHQEEEDPEYVINMFGGVLAILLSSVSLLLGTGVSLEGKRSTFDEVQPTSGLIVEPFTTPGSYTEKVVGERVVVSSGSTRIKTLTTDMNGRISLSEEDLLNAGFHPVSISRLSSISLNFRVAGRAGSRSVSLSNQDKQQSRAIINTQANQQLREAHFRDLVTRTSLPVEVSHNGRSEQYNVSIENLSAAFFRDHYGRNEAALREAYGDLFRNCHAISHNPQTGALLHREVYRCLSRSVN